MPTPPPPRNPDFIVGKNQILLNEKLIWAICGPQTFGFRITPPPPPPPLYVIGHVLCAQGRGGGWGAACTRSSPPPPTLIVVVRSPCQENYPADAQPSALKSVLESANPARTRSVHLDAPGQRHGQQPVPGTADPGVVKQDKSSRGSVDTTKTRSGPQRVRMSSGERPIGAAKGKQSDTEASCQTPPHARTMGPWL